MIDLDRNAVYAAGQGDRRLKCYKIAYQSALTSRNYIHLIVLLFAFAKVFAE